MATRIAQSKQVRLPEGVKLTHLFSPESDTPLSSRIFDHITSIADRAVKARQGGHIRQDSFAVLTDLSALYHGPELVSTFYTTYMLRADFYRMPQDFEENLLPRKFKDLLVALVESNEDEDDEFDSDEEADDEAEDDNSEDEAEDEEDEDDDEEDEADDEEESEEDNAFEESVQFEHISNNSPTLEITIPPKKKKPTENTNLRATAQLVLKSSTELIDLFYEISQNVSQYLATRTEDQDKMQRFVALLSDLEEKINSLRPYFEEHGLYLHPARFLAGWEDKVIFAVAQKLFSNNISHPKFKFNKNLAAMLHILRNTFGASLHYFSDLPTLVARSIQRSHSDFAEFTPIDPEIDFSTNFVHSSDLFKVQGSTIPYYASNINPAEAREYYRSTIVSIMPVPLVIIKSTYDIRLAIEAVLEGGYAIFIGETAQDAHETFAAAISLHTELTDLQKDRCIFASTY